MRCHTPQARAERPAAAAVVQPKPAPHPVLAPTGTSTGFSFADVPVHAPRPGGTGLPERLRAGIEHLSGLAMDDVRVHHNSAEPAKLGALAFAQGSDIHLGPGQEQHLPHEAWHVVQQKQGRVQATMQMKGGAGRKQPGLESEADVMALQLARKQEAQEDEPTKMHQLEEPATSYVAALCFEQGIQFRPLTDKVAGSPKTDGFAERVQEEMRKVLITKYHWKFEYPSRKTFKFGINLLATNEVSVGGTIDGDFFGRGQGGEPEKTLQDAFDQAVKNELDRRQAVEDDKAAKKAARKAKKAPKEK